MAQQASVTTGLTLSGGGGLQSGLCMQMPCMRPATQKCRRVSADDTMKLFLYSVPRVQLIHDHPKSRMLNLLLDLIT